MAKLMKRNDYTIPCNECQSGQMRPSTATYFTWLGDALITVPDFPCWVCDICGRREYDPKALNALNLLLSPNAGSPTPRPPRTPQAGTSTAHKARRLTPPE